MSDLIRIAIDANEANITNRVGSNVYAFEVIRALEALTKDDPKYSFTILTSAPPISELPKARKNWQYQLIKPRHLSTQIGLPMHLFLNQDKYDVFFTPGHYAPRNSSVPYVSSVMDLAFLKYPDQFKKSDLVQLTKWTKYSVKKAKKVITISNFSKSDIIKTYHKKPQDVVVAYPSATERQRPTLQSRQRSFFRKHHLKQPYILFLGTFQPRKNLIRLIEAYESLCRQLSAKGAGKKKGRSASRRRTGKTNLPQLVLAGKIGWLADDIVERIHKSPFFSQIVMPGFVSEDLKPALYQKASCSVLVGLYEGFGIPALESLLYNCIPVVSNTTSLPEVVGKAGILVDPENSKNIAQGLDKALKLTAKRKAQLRRYAREQLKKFSWEKAAQTILKTLTEVATND